MILAEGVLVVFTAYFSYAVWCGLSVLIRSSERRLWDRHDTIVFVILVMCDALSAFALLFLIRQPLT